MKAPEDIWRELANEPCSEGGYTRRRIKMSSGLNAFLALAMPDRRPSLLVEAASESVPVHHSHPPCLGFRFSVATLESAPHRRVMMMLELGDFRYRDVFAALAQDVLSCLATAKDEKSGVRTLLDRLRRWVDFFQRQKSNGLSEQEQQGLYGELWLIKNTLSKYLATEDAVLSWQGPKGANQDFHLPSCAVEVKTSVSSPHEKVTVSNVLQLDETGVPALVMAHLALDRHRSMGETLPGIVGGIRCCLAENAPHMTGVFNALLVNSGYLEVHFKQYLDTGYHVRHARYYRVRDDFPRLLEHSLPEGVGDVRYTVVMSACVPFEITADDLRGLLTGGGHDRL